MTTYVSINYKFSEGFEDLYSMHLRDKITEDEFHSSMREINTTYEQAKGTSLIVLPFALFLFLIVPCRLAFSSWNMHALGIALAILCGLCMLLFFYLCLSTTKYLYKAMEKVISEQNVKYQERGIIWHFVADMGNQINVQISPKNNASWML
eukprot:Phypoly_transcript_22737.p1 GENE.Phypoly_transcript_22737~~Phypoly_transcript_22737.p1  ORF type:complete len:175 (+),score=8.58 Phypoly_transcript_22737:74-526(+)